MYKAIIAYAQIYCHLMQVIILSIQLGGRCKSLFRSHLGQK